MYGVAPFPETGEGLGSLNARRPGKTTAYNEDPSGVRDLNNKLFPKSGGTMKTFTRYVRGALLGIGALSLLLAAPLKPR